MLAHLQDLKAEMNKLRDGERAKLTKMTVESNTAIKTMKSKVEKVCLVKINVESNQKFCHFIIFYIAEMFLYPFFVFISAFCFDLVIKVNLKLQCKLRM